jgi:hypothetical protein
VCPRSIIVTLLHLRSLHMSGVQLREIHQVSLHRGGICHYFTQLEISLCCTLLLSSFMQTCMHNMLYLHPCSISIRKYVVSLFAYCPHFVADVNAGESAARVGGVFKRVSPCPTNTYGFEAIRRGPFWGLKGFGCNRCPTGLITDLVTTQVLCQA